MKAGVATLDGKAYYAATELLRQIKIPFVSLSPGDEAQNSVGVVITTRRERALVQHSRVLCIEDIMESPEVAKETILHTLYGEEGHPLIIGIDPGMRIGLSAHYGRREVESIVLTSPRGVIRRVLELARAYSSTKVLLRIGDGEPELSSRLAEALHDALRGEAEIEIVDERGTSSRPGMRPNKRGSRDRLSAAVIAFRRGRRYP